MFDLYKKASLIPFIFIALLCISTVTYSATCPGSGSCTTEDGLTSVATQWYVPSEFLISYSAPVNNILMSFTYDGKTFSSPVPTGDQTIWNINSCSGGCYSGTTTSSLYLRSPSGDSVSSSSTLITEGYVTNTSPKQIRMSFTSSQGTIIGIGQMRTYDLNGTSTQAMEMQMFSLFNLDSSSYLLAHWAYMLPYSSLGSGSPPDASTFVVNSNLSPQWNWTQGTVWKFVNPTLFGTNTGATLQILRYTDGYFWGQGKSPNNGEYFTLIGTITPEGNVLLTTNNNNTLNSVGGQILGDSNSAEMILHYYENFEEFGNTVYMYLIQPFENTMLNMNNPSAYGAASELFNITTSNLGVEGDMAPLVNTLINMNNTDLSNSISQTLPLLVGAGSQATAKAQSNVYSSLYKRQATNSLLIAKTKTTPFKKNIWVEVLGTNAEQKEVSNVSGYKINSRNIILGIDQNTSALNNIGVFFALGNDRIKSNSSVAASNIDLDHYQVGGYGEYLINSKLSLSYQFSQSLNRNKGSRNISFYNATSSSSYNSYTTRASLDLKTIYALSGTLNFIPSFGTNYLVVNSESYQETGAGILDLKVNSQRYQEMYHTSNLTLIKELYENIKLTTSSGIGFNSLNKRNKITATFSGGGNNFVTEGLKPSPWLYNAGIGVIGIKSKIATFELKYDVAITNSSYLNQALNFLAKINL